MAARLLLMLLFSLLTYVVTQKEEHFNSSISHVTTNTIKYSTVVNKNTNLKEQESLKPIGADIPGLISSEYDLYYTSNNSTTSINRFGNVNTKSDHEPCDSPTITYNMSDKTEEPIKLAIIVPKPKGCGVSNPNGIGFWIKDVKENETQFAEFPWMVAILSEEIVKENIQKLLIYQCGGSLVHPKVVLTAAHCVTGEDKEFKIRAGEWDTQSKRELFPHQDRYVKNTIIHPEYNTAKYFNDVAVLILDSPVEIAPNVNTVCLPKQAMVVEENTRCYASGWGKNSFGKEGRYQIILKKIGLPIVANNVCQEHLRTTRLGKKFKLNESFICAGGEAGVDTCKGDGGSPLVCPVPGHPGKYFQAGIVSWGIGCGEKQIPGVYADVARFADWVDEQIHNLDRSYYIY